MKSRLPPDAMKHVNPCVSRKRSSSTIGTYAQSRRRLPSVGCGAASRNAAAAAAYSSTVWPANAWRIPAISTFTSVSSPA